MSDVKHTPGPWERRSPTRVYGNLQRDQNRTGDLVAVTVSEADAGLIAAVPELLDALHQADGALANITAFEEDARCIMGNTNFVIVQRARTQVRAAIALAEGK